VTPSSTSRRWMRHDRPPALLGSESRAALRGRTTYDVIGADGLWMWRVMGPSGTLSHIVNKTGAKR
jgi:hypothetical protein